VIWQT